MSAAISAYGSGKWTASGQPALLAGGIGPVGDQAGQRVAQAGLGSSGARHRQDRVRRAEQADVAEHVLPVLAAHDDHVPAGRIGDDGGREVGAARVVVAPLRREQVDDGHALGPRLEQRRGRRDEVDVAVDRDPVRRRRARRPARAAGRAGRGRVAVAVRRRAIGGAGDSRTRGPPRPARPRPAARSGTGPGRTRRSPRRGPGPRRCPR